MGGSEGLILRAFAMGLLPASPPPPSNSGREGLSTPQALGLSRLQTLRPGAGPQAFAPPLLQERPWQPASDSVSEGSNAM